MWLGRVSVCFVLGAEQSHVDRHTFTTKLPAAPSSGSSGSGLLTESEGTGEGSWEWKAALSSNNVSHIGMFSSGCLKVKMKKGEINTFFTPLY